MNSGPPEVLTELLQPSAEVVAFTARMFSKMIQHGKSDHDTNEAMRCAYRHILEVRAHELGLKFQTENPEMEYGHKA